MLLGQPSLACYFVGLSDDKSSLAGIVLGRDIEIFSHIFPKNPIAILKWLIFTIGISSEYVLS